MQQPYNQIKIMEKNICSSPNVMLSKCFVVIAFTIILGGFLNEAQAQECYISPSPSPANFTAAGSGQSVDIVRVGDCTLTIVSYPSWILSVQNNGTYILIQAALNTGAERSGSVWLDYGGNNYYVNLTQAGVPIPAITSQPSNQNKCENETASFSVTASNASSYQWYQSFNSGSYAVVNGATSSTYTFGVNPTMNNTRYRCVVSNVSGSATSSNALLTVNPATQVGNPLDVTVCSNAASATFNIGAAGSNLNFLWYRAINGGGFVPLSSEPGFSGINEPVLTVNDINGNANAQFKCYVYGTCPGGGLSNSATLFVTSPSLTVSNPQNQLICPGEVTTFSVSSSNALSFQWEEKTAASSQFTSIAGATSHTYTFTPTPDKAGAEYRCVVNGLCGSSAISNAALLEFHNVSILISKQPENKDVCEQEQVEINVEATTPGLIYQWQVSTNGGSTFSDIPGMTNSAYSFIAITEQSGNKYQVKIRHPLCNTFITSSQMTLTVRENPVLEGTINASATSISIGEDVVLTITPSSPGVGETWRWYVLNSGNSLTIGSEASIKVNPKTTTTYHVNANSCSGNGKSITITFIERFSDENYIYTVRPKVPMVLRTDNNVIEEIVYFDGLGRPMQSIAIQGSPERNDIITPVVYDEFGREVRKYLPFVSGNDGSYKPNRQIIDDETHKYIGIVTTYDDVSDNIPDDTRPFSEVFFEPSPLNRPDRSYGPGQAWAPSGQGSNNKYIQHQYLSNVHGVGASETAEAIIAWEVNEEGMPTHEPPVTDYIASGGFYLSNQIFINITVDEHGNAVREYTNKQGQVILKKVQVVTNSTNLNNVDEWACTYYVYDDLGNLRFVLPPEGVKQYLAVIAQQDN